MGEHNKTQVYETDTEREKLDIQTEWQCQSCTGWEGQGEFNIDCSGRNL